MSAVPVKTDKKAYNSEKNNVIRLFKDNQIDSALAGVVKLKDWQPDDYEIHYIDGMIAATRYLYADAIQSFKTAIKLNHRHKESYYELGYIQMRLCRFNVAAAYFKKARAFDYRTPEINSFLSQIKRVAREKDVTLSACLIVKNEEKYLPGCLKSLQAVCDEIVIVDTGSEDNTVKIAEEFGAKIFHYKWINDFADARNFANKNATGDWIIQLDADEELFPEDQHKMREVIHQDKCNGAYLALHNRVSNTFGENMPSIHYLVRLFKNTPEFYYENAIHEVLKISGEVTPYDINILHHGYNLTAETMETKRRRNSEILYKKLEDNPDDAMTLFYLSMMHVGCREFDLAESFAWRAIEKINENNAKQQHIHLMLLNNLAIIYSDRGNLDKVIEVCQKSIEINENYLDPFYFKATAHYRRNELDKAKELYLHYIAKNKELTEKPLFNLFGSSANTYLYQVYHFLGKIYRRQKDDLTAQKYILKSVEINPNFWIGYIDLAYIFKDKNDLAAAAQYFDRAINLAKKNPEVKEENEMLWHDFMAAVKSYMQVLKTLGKARLN